MKVVTPEAWYVLFWTGLTLSACAFGYFVGPHIIAKGLDLWMKGSSVK